MAFQNGWIHGSTVVDGQLQFLSASSAQKFERCERQWFYAYVHRPAYKEDDTDATKRGKENHDAIATFHKTGRRDHLNSVILHGLHMCEPPGPDLLVEHDILIRPGPMPDFTRANSAELLAAAPVRACGVPFTGAIDLLHARGTNRGGTSIEDTRDPPGTVEVVDYKFPKTLDHALAPHELLNTVQMPSYSEYAFAVEPNAKLVRLSHIYMPVRGSGRKSSILVDREKSARAWKRVESLVGSIRDVARETDPEKVPANTDACHMFGRDCPAIGVCSAGKYGPLSSIVGLTATSRLKSDIAQGIQDQMTTPTTPAPGSIMARLNAAKAATATTPAPSPSPVLGSLGAAAQTPAAPPPPDPAAIAAERARLAREEAAAKYPDLLKTLADIEACGLGKPAIGGELAKAYAALTGMTLEGQGYAGTGELASFTFLDPAQLPGVLAEARQIAQQRAQPAPAPAPTVAAVLPPDAPASNPVLASARPAPAPAASPTTATDAVAAAAEGAKKRGRPKKDKDAPAPTVAAPAPDAVTAGVTAPPEVAESRAADAAPAPAVGAINLYVNVLVDGAPMKRLEPIIDAICAAMSKDSGSPDFRYADPNGKYGFGRWKGVEAACIRDTPIAPGDYAYDGRGEIFDVAVETMRELVRKSGGRTVVGGR